MTLEMELGMSYSEANSEGWRGSDEGNEIKASTADVPGWNGSNESGFTAVPAGFRHSTGFFYSAGSGCIFLNLNAIIRRSLNSSFAQIYRYEDYSNDIEREGGSVRCVRD
jgi:uncharacterized protein (TIGR02145 family)